MSTDVEIDVSLSCPVPVSYASNRVKSMFNATDEQAASVNVSAQLRLSEIPDWSIGAVVGPSGSGKSTIGSAIWGGEGLTVPGEGWGDGPVIDRLADTSFDAATSALSAVGLGDVPAWLRPYRVLSTGQKFRADLALALVEAPERIVLDEFTSVVDRQIARVGAGAFGKAWRRTEGQAVVLSCHYDILEWLEPCWVWDTATDTFEVTRGRLRRPRIEVDIEAVAKSAWDVFKPHHYLDSGPMPFSIAYCAFVDGEPVAHLGVGSKSMPRGRVEARACRMVVMPEWQGAGLGMRFLNTVCQAYLDGDGHLPRTTTQFHTSHPGLVAALRRDPKWSQVSAVLYGGSGAASRRSLAAAGRAGSYGGHLRAVQGFRYHGGPS